jgi:hypothetical protein
MKKRGFTATGLSHDGDKFALFYIERNTAQSVCFDLSDFVDFG